MRWSILESLLELSQPFTPCHNEGVAYWELFQLRRVGGVSLLLGFFNYRLPRQGLLKLTHTRPSQLVSVSGRLFFTTEPTTTIHYTADTSLSLGLEMPHI